MLYIEARDPEPQLTCDTVTLQAFCISLSTVLSKQSNLSATPASANDQHAVRITNTALEESGTASGPNGLDSRQAPTLDGEACQRLGLQAVDLASGLFFQQNSHPVHRQLLSGLRKLPPPSWEAVIESLVRQVILLHQRHTCET